ncbi:hypothetical protein CHLRE_10g453700v5 [Chlamydomonas reinhardtii]|uniref:Uncharacterized protein n=1 Tax=Chlamydomonas reinhardtii TaxID=3055 RepID=A0A2K3DBC9_CHLRE|nr:uncharacterized protein CHLRE_10g453700v5 [Chlamydomonas reinhardtii]PNW77831.1 hypothetical protein CHLRE_10g453700v5 [Chlamydomonas reinhardtii]
MAQTCSHPRPTSSREDLWARLTPELIHKISSYLHPNEVITSVKLLNRETADCLHDSFRSFVLGCKQEYKWEPYRAEQPWPGRDFVAHWGRPGPWRGLSLAQRHRLLCLAASSGHLPSLDAALAQCGCTLTSGALASAAAGGSVAACERLLGAGDEGSHAASAAAAVGHMPVLRLLLDRTGLLTRASLYATSCTAAAWAGQLPALQLLLDFAAGGAKTRVIRNAAAGAFAGGQREILVWLQQAHGYSPSLGDAVAAARGGHVAVLEQLMPPVLQPDRPPAAAASAGNDSEQNRVSRTALLEAITAGCPVEVLQRHYARLWSLPARADANGELGEDAAAAAAASNIRRVLLNAVAGSGTDCWGRKLDFLLSAWGPAVVARELQKPATLAFEASLQPDYTQRLRRLHAAGMPLGVEAMEYAARFGHVDALTYLLDEAGAPVAAIDTAFVRGYVLACRPKHAVTQQLLRLLKERGYTFTAADVKMAASHRWLEESLLALIQMVVDGDTDGDDRSRWSAAFVCAAYAGAGICVLQALRARGAAVDLAAVAKGGSEEALDWAAAELEAEQEQHDGGLGGVLAPLGPSEIHWIHKRGNLAALRWLHRRGLLDGRSVSWLAGRVELGVAPAAAGGVEH